MGSALSANHERVLTGRFERVILMRGGRIVGDGPREELLTAPRLSVLFNVPVRIGRDEEWLHSW